MRSDKEFRISRRDFIKSVSSFGASFFFARISLDTLQDKTRSGTFEYCWTPLLDHYFFLRFSIASKNPPKGWEEALKEFQKAQSLLSEPFGFALIDGIVTGFEDYEKLENYAMKAPEKSSRGSLLRVPLESIAKAMRLSRPLYEKNLKQKHKEQFQKKLQDIEKGFSPHEQDVVDFMIRGLRFPKETLRVPIILVAFAPHPGGLTVRSSNNGAVCIIGMSQFSGSTFYEAIVHESIHAFDATFASSDNALSMLREMLLRNGVGREDAIYRNLPHTLMFVHSAEAIRKYVNRKHRPYGETSGYYSKMGKISELVETHWQEYLKKGDNLETTLQLVVEKALKNT